MATHDKLTDFGALPAFSTVLTGVGGPLDLRLDAKREQFAVIVLDPVENRVVWFLSAPDASGHERMSLRSDILKAGYQVGEARIASPDLLRDIHASGRRPADVVVGAELGDEESIQWMDRTLQMAVTVGATDIHIEPRERGPSRVRMRIHGKLETVERPEPGKVLRAISAAYTMRADASTRSDPTFSFSDERNCILHWPLQGQARRFRMESFPVEDGHDAVLRVLHGATRILTLEELGYAPYHVEILMLALLASSGLTAVTGTTGSGKSTTLLSLMALHPELEQIKSLSLEDPVEYLIPLISQYSVRRGAGDLGRGEEAYGKAVRTFLRSDPDQVMIGEVRGPDVAKELVAMVQTGHRVLTTLHTGSALYAIPRMTHAAIGLDRQTLCTEGFLSALAYQALLPKLCDHCAEPALEHLPAEYFHMIGKTFRVEDYSKMRVRGRGCSAKGCHKGTAGQTLAAEVIAPTSHLLDLLMDGKDAAARNYWRLTKRAGFSEPDMEGKTAFEHGLYKVLQGLVDPRDLEHTFEPFASYRYKMPVGTTAEDRGIR